MKIRYRKHASKFVYGLFQGCGLVTCLSLTACGGNNKENQKKTNLGNFIQKLKDANFFNSEAEAESFGKELFLKGVEDINDLQIEHFNNKKGVNQENIKKFFSKRGVKIKENSTQQEDISENSNALNNMASPIVNDIETPGQSSSVDSTTSPTKIDGNLSNEKVNTEKNSENTTTTSTTETTETTKIECYFGDGLVKIGVFRISIEMNNLGCLTRTLQDLIKGNVQVQFQNAFSLEWKGNVYICNKSILCNNVDIFKNILSLLTCLNKLGLVTEKIKINCRENEVLFGNTDFKYGSNKVVFNRDMVKNVKFWQAIKENSDLFNFEYDPLYIKKGLDSTYVFIYNDSNKNYQTIPGIALIQPDVFFENTTESTDKWILRTEWQNILNEGK